MTQPTTTCATVAAGLDAYLAGALDARDCAAIERHAGDCVRCAALLEDATRRPIVFAPAPPPPLAARTLAAVAARRRRRRAGVLAAGLAAAALLVTLAVRPSGPEPVSVVTAVPGGAPAIADDVAMLRTARARADAAARDEFAALDRAARELDAAIEAQPDDVALRAFLASVQARRAELRRRVDEVAT